MNIFLSSAVRFGSISSLLGLLMGTPKQVRAEELAPPALAAASETAAQRDARMAWWREARFGLFIHWGLYAVPAGFYHGHPTRGRNGEWIMNDEKIPIAEYAEFAPQFDPVNFDAEAWVKLARDAGMKYIVITAKHHEGFAMFHTKVDGYNLFDATPFKRDPIKELADACHKYGLKFGLYYSQNLDWHHPGGGGGGWDPAHKGDPELYVKSVVVPQVREILSSYGEISVLWWDIPGGVINKDRADLIYQTVMDCNPHIIMNNRLGGGYRGDTETPEQHIPAQGFGDRDWETCMTINNTWGFRKDDTNWKSTETLLRNLIDIASKGGNYLLNVGPDSFGVIPAPEAKRLQEVGAWLKVNGEAIYGARATPFDAKFPWGRATQKAGKLYLHVFSWPKNGKLLLPVRNAVKKAYLIAAPEQSLAVGAASESGVELTLPADAPDPIASVIAVEVGEAIDPISLTMSSQNDDGSVRLGADAAKLLTSGGGQVRARLEGPAESQNIGYWTQARDYAQWTVKITKPGNFDVSLDYSADPAFAGSKVTLSVGEQSVSGPLASTGSWEKYENLKLGSVRVAQPGMLTVTLKPDDAKTAVCNLRRVLFVPAP